MPKIVRVGYAVSSRTGPLYLPIPGAKRRSHSILHGIILGSSRLSSVDQRTWNVMWTECGKCCDHSATILKVLTSTYNSFDISEYSTLWEVDYYHSLASLLEYIDKDTFYPGFEVVLKQQSISSTSVPTHSTADVPPKLASVVRSLLILASTSENSEQV